MQINNFSPVIGCVSSFSKKNQFCMFSYLLYDGLLVMLLKFLVIAATLLLACSTSAEADNATTTEWSDADKLMEELIQRCGYLRSRNRPVSDYSKAIKVKITFRHIKILKIDDSVERYTCLLNGTTEITVFMLC